MANEAASDNKRTLEDAIGGPPSEAFRSAWAALHDCTGSELAYLRIDGIRAIQLTRVVAVEGEK